jgi:hypothetical protein
MKMTLRVVAHCVALSIAAIVSVVPGRPVPAQSPAGEDEKTGEWRGTFDWSSRNPVPAGVQYFGGHLDLALDEYEDGTLKGALTGSQTQKLDLTVCPSVALAPGSVAARLTGQIADRQVTMSIAEPTSSPPQMSPCPQGRPPATGPAVFKYPHFDEALNSLALVGTNDYAFDQEWTIDWGRGFSSTLHYTVKFERIRILPRAED